MKTYYIVRNLNNEIEEIFVDVLAARDYAKACGFKMEAIQAATCGE